MEGNADSQIKGSFELTNEDYGKYSNWYPVIATKDGSSLTKTCIDSHNKKTLSLEVRCAEDAKLVIHKYGGVDSLGRSNSHIDTVISTSAGVYPISMVIDYIGAEFAFELLVPFVEETEMDGPLPDTSVKLKMDISYEFKDAN